jgi:ABC-type multidrug transport system fused ATPase/permease subunit
VGGSLWMVEWTENEDSSKDDYYLGIYTILSVGISLGAGVRAATILLCCFYTGRKIHKGMIKHLLYAPLNEFFDRIPLGRILNRLTKDLSILDTMIAFSLASFMASFFYLLGTAFLCVYASSLWVLIPIVLYLIICMYVY